MKPTALVEHAESPRPVGDSMASTARPVQPMGADVGPLSGTADVAQPICDGIEPPPLDWQSLIVASAFVLACLGVLASLLR